MLPAQYVYIHTTYTVNSFGKAPAHVRNCMLKKKHMAQINTLTDSTGKRHKNEDSASFCKNKENAMPTYSIYNSPDPKGHVSYCHHLVSVVRP